MDSGGNIYASKAIAETWEREVAARVREMRTPERMPRSTVAIKNPEVARALASLNRKARLAFYAQRKKGVEEYGALAAAEATVGRIERGRRP